MITIVIGGSGSGKSEYAEGIAVASAMKADSLNGNGMKADSLDRNALKADSLKRNAMEADCSKRNATKVSRLEDRKRFYIATMQPFGSETLEKIARHHELRKDKGFTTIERYVDVDKSGDMVNEHSIVLLECMSNLLANEVYRPDREELGLMEDQAVVDKVVAEILRLEEACSHLILVTNDIFASGETYDPETMRYIEMLGQINARLAKKAELVVEVICGIPLVIYEKMKKEER